MQVRRARIAGRARVAEDPPRPHLLARLHRDTRVLQVPVDGEAAVRMPHAHEVALVAQIAAARSALAAPLRLGHHAVARRHHRRALRHREVDRVAAVARGVRPDHPPWRLADRERGAVQVRQAVQRLPGLRAKRPCKEKEGGAVSGGFHDTESLRPSGATGYGGPYLSPPAGGGTGRQSPERTPPSGYRKDLDNQRPRPEKGAKGSRKKKEKRGEPR